MSVTPAGILSLPLKYLRDTLAASSNFRTFVGAASVELALAKIYPVVTTTVTPPFAVVDWGSFQRTENADKAFDTAGNLRIILRGSINSEHSDADAAFTFFNALGAIIADLESLAGQAGYLDIVGIRLDSFDRPEEQEVQSSGDFYQAVLSIDYKDGAL